MKFLIFSKDQAFKVLTMLLGVLLLRKVPKKLIGLYIAFKSRHSEQIFMKVNESTKGQNHHDKIYRISFTKILTFLTCVLSLYSLLHHTRNILQHRKHIEQILNNNIDLVLQEPFLRFLKTKIISRTEILLKANLPANSTRIVDAITTPPDIIKTNEPYQYLRLESDLLHNIVCQISKFDIYKWAVDNGKIQNKVDEVSYINIILSSLKSIIGFAPWIINWIFSPKILDFTVFMKDRLQFAKEVYIVGKPTLPELSNDVVVKNIKFLSDNPELLLVYLRRIILRNGIIAGISLGVFIYTIKYFVFKRKSKSEEQKENHVHYDQQFKAHHIPVKDEYKPWANYELGTKLTRNFIIKNKENLVLITCECERFFKNVVFKDCHHCVYCYHCYTNQKPKTCPICKAKVNGYFNLQYC